MLITRKSLILKINNVLNGKITIKKLYEWVDKFYPSKYETDDWEGDDSKVVNVMAEIDTHNIDDLTKDDLKRIKKYLKS